jgi:hypothetical protein
MGGLLEELARRWDSFWRRDQGQERRRPFDDRRRRFWSEFREGQREANETSAEKPTPRSR